VQVGSIDGVVLDKALGELLGSELGAPLDDELGLLLGEPLGITLGETLGTALGDALGVELGAPLGDELGQLNTSLGQLVVMPSHTSATSHNPVLARHSVPSLEGSSLPTQTPAPSHVPPVRQLLGLPQSIPSALFSLTQFPFCGLQTPSAQEVSKPEQSICVASQFPSTHLSSVVHLLPLSQTLFKAFDTAS
jgi:hypothetical protein